MIDINLTNLFDDFYHTRFFVLVNLSLFSFLLALRLDETIEWSYWLVFMPLWIWKVTAFFGMIFGTISWCRLSRRRFDSETFLHYKAMLISFSTNLVLFLFEIIVCDKLESQNKIPWSICFIPMFILSLISIGTCIWSIRHDRSYEIELFCALNLLQFVFVSLRLDQTITWSWVLVLIPLWILMCIAFIILLYFVIITIIILSRSHPNNLQHHTHYKPTQRWLNVIYYTCFVFSLLAFEIVLTQKLDAVMYSPNIMHHFQIFMQPNPPPSGYLSSSQSSQNHHQYIQPSQHQSQQQSFLLEKSLYFQNRQQQQQYSVVAAQRAYLAATAAVSNLHLAPPPPPQPELSMAHQGSSPLDLLTTLTSSSTSRSTTSSTTSTTSSSSSSSPFSDIKLSYFLTVLPLQLSYLCLMLLSFNSHSGNLWWFGMRRDFCELFLIICPAFKIYGNVQLKFSCFSIEDAANARTSASGPSGGARNSSASATINNSNRIRNLRNLNRTGSTSDQTDSVQHHQQQQSLIAAAANNPSGGGGGGAGDNNSNETSLVTLNMNIFRHQQSTNPSHPTTLRGTGGGAGGGGGGGASSSISQQNQLIASDFDEISSMDDCLDVALTTMSTSSSGGTPTAGNSNSVVTFNAAPTTTTTTTTTSSSNRRIKFLNKKFNLKRNFKMRNVGTTGSAAASRRGSNNTVTVAAAAVQPVQTAQPPTTQRQYSFRSYQSAYSSADRCSSEKSSRKSKAHNCLSLSHLHGSSSSSANKHQSSQAHQLNRFSMGTIIQLDLPD